MNQVNFNCARKKWKELTCVFIQLFQTIHLNSVKSAAGNKNWSRESLKLANTSFEIFNFVWIQHYLFVNIKLSRTVVSSRNTVYREQVILYSFYAHYCAKGFWVFIFERPKKRETDWQNSVIKNDIDIVGPNTVFVGIMREKETIALNTSMSIRYANVKAGAPLTGGSSWYTLLANSWH